MTSQEQWLPWLFGLSVVLGIVFLAWYWITKSIANNINDFAARAAAVKENLEDFENACAARPGWDSPYVELSEIVRNHAATLDECGSLVRTAELIESQVHVLVSPPFKYFFQLNVTAADIRDLRNELGEARRSALADVHYVLTDVLPDMREKLSQLPIQGSSIGLGVLTLVGTVWMSGFYGILGVPFIPLLRELKDIVLVGFGSGLLPLVVFTGMAGLTLFSVWRARDIARRPTARAEEIVDALEVARSLRQPRFWAYRAFLCLFAVFLVSVAAAALAVGRNINTFDVAVTEKPGTERMGILGGIGDYYVLVRSANLRIVTLPKEKLECFETVLPGQQSYCVQSESSPNQGQQIELALNQSEDWRSYVQREAQCWVVAPTTRRPLLSPVFVTLKSKQLDLDFYLERRRFWPYPKDCSSNPTLACAVDGMYSELIPWLHDAAASKSKGASLHFFGFASGTALPELNNELGGKRAAYIADLLINHADELKGKCSVSPSKPAEACPVEIQIHAIGEMPNFNWAGTQGDPTEQVVLIAACDNTTL